ncbi:MAG: hypothetical protein AAF074_23805, partial [Pseudomonadota bacterium]
PHDLEIAIGVADVPLKFTSLIEFRRRGGETKLKVVRADDDAIDNTKPIYGPGICNRVGWPGLRKVVRFE